jgi:hypothetical protein
MAVAENPAWRRLKTASGAADLGSRFAVCLFYSSPNSPEEDIVGTKVYKKSCDARKRRSYHHGDDEGATYATYGLSTL